MATHEKWDKITRDNLQGIGQEIMLKDNNLVYDTAKVEKTSKGFRLSKKFEATTFASGQVEATCPAYMPSTALGCIAGHNGDETHAIKVYYRAKDSNTWALKKDYTGVSTLDVEDKIYGIVPNQTTTILLSSENAGVFFSDMGSTTTNIESSTTLYNWSMFNDNLYSLVRDVGNGNKKAAIFSGIESGSVSYTAGSAVVQGNGIVFIKGKRWFVAYVPWFDRYSIAIVEIDMINFKMLSPVTVARSVVSYLFDIDDVKYVTHQGNSYVGQLQDKLFFVQSDSSDSVSLYSYDLSSVKKEGQIFFNSTEAGTNYFDYLNFYNYDGKLFFNLITGDNKLVIYSFDGKGIVREMEVSLTGKVGVIANKGVTGGSNERCLVCFGKLSYGDDTCSPPLVARSKYEAQGNIIDSIKYFDMLSPPVLHSITVDHLPLPANTNIKIYYKLNFASSWTLLGTSSTTSATSSNFLFSTNTTAGNIQVKVELNSTSDTATPEFVKYTLFYKQLGYV